MQPRLERFAEELAQRFAALNERIEAHVLAQMLSGRSTFHAYRFEMDAPTIRALMGAFEADACLWADFQRAVRAHRQPTHWQMLLEHVCTIGKLQGKLKLLEHSTSCAAPRNRRHIAEHLNGIDGEIAFCQDLADRRDLAKRVNTALDIPLIDGLTLRGLTYVLGEQPPLFSDLQALVEDMRQFQPARKADR
jgi:hypothetical protein